MRLGLEEFGGQGLTSSFGVWQGALGVGASVSTVAIGGVLDTHESQRPRFPSRTLFITSLVGPLMLWL